MPAPLKEQPPIGRVPGLVFVRSAFTRRPPLKHVLPLAAQPGRYLTRPDNKPLLPPGSPERERRVESPGAPASAIGRTLLQKWSRRSLPQPRRFAIPNRQPP